MNTVCVCVKIVLLEQLQLTREEDTNGATLRNSVEECGILTSRPERQGSQAVQRSQINFTTVSFATTLFAPPSLTIASSVRMMR